MTASTSKVRGFGAWAAHGVRIGGHHAQLCGWGCEWGHMYARSGSAPAGDGAADDQGLGGDGWHRPLALSRCSRGALGGVSVTLRVNRETTCQRHKERGRRWGEERRAGPCQSGSGSLVGGSARNETCGCTRGLGGGAGEGAIRMRAGCQTSGEGCRWCGQVEIRTESTAERGGDPPFRRASERRSSWLCFSTFS